MEPIGNIARLGQAKSTSSKPNIHLHSPAHLLADEFSVKLNDRRHFALYLGMATRYDHQFLRKIMGEVLESKGVKSPGKLFAFLVKKYNGEKNSTGKM